MRTLPLDHATRNAGRRPLRTAFLVLASSLVCGLLAATNAFVRSLERSHRRSAPPATALLLSTSASGDILRSAVKQATADLVAADVEDVLEIGGQKASSPEIHMGTDLRIEGVEGARAAVVRGVTERALLVHEAVTLTAGRWPGAGEVMVGALAATRCGVAQEELALGRKLRLEGGEFTVAGHFDAPGTTLAAEIWLPLIEVQSLTQRDDVSCVFVRLREEAALDEVEIFAMRRLDLELTSQSAQAYYDRLAGSFGPIAGLAWAMALLIAAAAVAGGANAISAAVQERTRELGTLRALGFPAPVLVWLLTQEFLLVALGGAVLGLLGARLLVSGAGVSMAMSAFELRVDAASMLVGAGGLLAVVLLGMLPALYRILRLPIVRALDGV